MPSHHLHLILSYQRATETGIADERCSAFLLGAVAPDAVTVHRDKLRTHYAVHVGITWGYRFPAFEREFAGYRERSVLHQYFYLGYKYHLFLDDAWMRECLRRTMFGWAIRRLTGSADGYVAQYYQEMSQLDAFHRSSVGPHVLRDAYACLARADFDLLPEFLDRDALNAILACLSNTMSQTAPRFDGKIIQARYADRFLLRASKVPVEL
jgi:hypothetical protein